MSRPLVVLSRKGDLDFPGVTTVTADEYLTGKGESLHAPGRVVNLSRSYRYLSPGYYVSLVADARRQQVEPSVDDLRALMEPHALFRALQEGEVPTVDPSEMATRRRAVDTDDDGAVVVRRTVGGNVQLGVAREDELASVLVLLGNAQDPRFRTIGRHTHDIWPFPVLTLRLLRELRTWRVWAVEPGAVHELSDAHRARLGQILAGTGGVRGRPAPREEKTWSLAVLHDENDERSPSFGETLDKLARIGAQRDVHVQTIGLSDLGRLAEYDALFIRAYTTINSPTWRFALRAETLGMPVIDDCASILRCGNKVYQHELLSRAGVPMPRSLVVGARTRYADIVEALGSPFVAKLPDGSFSQAVQKVESKDAWKALGTSWLRKSPLLVAQAWTPTEHDWRVGVLGGRVLFVAKYGMAKGHWQIAKETRSGVRYGRVEALPRASAPDDVVQVALRAAALIGEGFYGVDVKSTREGAVVIEVNDNPNLEAGLEDAADGNVIYEELLAWYAERIDRDRVGPLPPRPPFDVVDDIRRPIGVAGPVAEPPWAAWQVVGLELEYPIVDADLEAASAVAGVIRALAGHPASDVEMGVVGISNEIFDHVLEIKTVTPLPSLVDTEAALFEGVRRVNALLADRFGARLLPTAMHPWLDPAGAHLWTRSNRRIYETYARLFDVRTHGWANVQASHVNLPLGDEDEAVRMMNAAALLVPYLPAVAASSPMYDGRLQEAVDGRLHFIIEHQARIRESCGDLVPEYVDSLAAYRRDVLGPMYAAVDRLPDAGMLRHEYFNARGAVFKFSRTSMEVRVLDVQECVKMDCAIAAFVRGALRWLAEGAAAGPLPEHDALVRDFREVVRLGSRALVEAPHLAGDARRDPLGRLPVGVALGEVLAGARTRVRDEEQPYLDLVARVIAHGSLSERMAAWLRRSSGHPEAGTRATRQLYRDLCDCLSENRPWPGRWPSS